MCMCSSDPPAPLCAVSAAMIGVCLQFDKSSAEPQPAGKEACIHSKSGNSAPCVELAVF